jgi:aryl carrier-like protein
MATWVQAQRTDMALRTWTVGGEALPGASVTLLQNACPPATLLNGYGPTEAVITPLVWVAPAAACTTAYAPIGKAVGERTTYILDAARRVVPAGVVGELYIGGTGLARGYHGQPGLTAERFAPDPFSAVPGRRLYRTGDLARWQADGTIDYVGRADLQVKIRGFRIELGEIEAVLLTHTAIAAAVVVARDARAGASQALTPAGGRASAADAAFSDQRLVAYLVPAQHALPAPGDLRQFLHQRLPDYMVPALFIRLEALPLTPNGKIDRRALPVPERWRAEPEAAYMAPRTEMQRLIASIWQDVLHVEQVGIHDNFFDLGGHSLAMTKVWYSLRTRLHQDLAMLDLFQNPTIHALATHLSREPRAPLVPQPAAAVDDKIQAGKNRLKQQLLRHQNVPPGGRADA